MSTSPLAFFVQNNWVTPLTIPVAQYARARGIALEDRSSTPEFNPDDCGIDWTQYGCILPYGSVQFIRKLKASSLSSHIDLNPDKFATSTWAPLFGTRALNGEGFLLRASDVGDHLKYPMHLRPDSEDKAFAGKVYSAEDWEDLYPSLSPDLQCWASIPQEIEAEWRCWVVDGKVVEISQYRKAGQHFRQAVFDPLLFRQAQAFANSYTPARHVVMDLAEVKGKFRLVEFNPFYSSGWYAADIPKILDAWIPAETLYLRGHSQ